MWVVSIAHHRWANRGDEAFLYREGIVVVEEGQNLFVRQAARVFGKGLGGDADGSDFETSFFVGGFGLSEELQCIFNLSLILRAVEPHKRGDGANFGF